MISRFAQIKNYLLSNPILFYGIGLYWMLTGVLTVLILLMCDGHYVYPLDDTYIHMAMAKNTAQHFIWGVTKYEFTSSTSSPLWTLILSVVYFLTGVHQFTPVILNAVFGTLIVVLGYRIALELKYPRWLVGGVLALSILSIPLPALTILGMEPLPHVFFTMLFFIYSTRILSNEDLDRSNWKSLLLITPALVGFRYESVFLVFVTAAYLIFNRKLLKGVILGCAAVLPIILYGLFSLWHDWYFIPNSILLKSDFIRQYILREKLDISIEYLWVQFYQNLHIVVLILLGIILLIVSIRRNAISNRMRVWNTLFLGAILFHVKFASTGWFYRYEAYLMFPGIILSAEALLLWDKRFHTAGRADQSVIRSIFGLVVPLLFLGPLCFRAGHSLSLSVLAANNIYEQQYQMGHFINEYYAGKSIILNDIGAVNYFADIQSCDLVGLGGRESAELYLSNRLRTAEFDSLARHWNADIAVVYESWFTGGKKMPASWIPAGYWRLKRVYICGGEMVTFFACRPDEREYLKRSLAEFAVRLPSGVIQSGQYRNPR